MKGSNKKSSGVEETKNQEESKDKEGSISSNQDQPESALQNLVETGEDGGPIKKVTGYATLKDLAMLARVNKKFQSAMNKEIKQRELFIHSIFTGRNHTMILVKTKQGQNKLFASGIFVYGEWGRVNEGLIQFTRDRNEWTEVPFPKGFKLEQVAVRNYHSFLIGKGVNGEDKLFATGSNSSGQFGLGDRRDRSEWTEVNIPQGFRLEQVIAGYYHTFLKGTVGGQDKLFACGNNFHGQVGLGRGRAICEWTEVTLPRGFSVEKVLVGTYHSILKGKGVNGEAKLYVTGNNDYGQLGLGDRRNRSEWTEVDIPPGFRLEKIIVGLGHYDNHSFLIGKGKVDGEDKLYACGGNKCGQLGLDDTTNRDKWTEVNIPQGFRIEKVMAGGYHSFLKGTVGGQDKLYGCGANYVGQLGLGDNDDRTRWTALDIPPGFRLEQVAVGYNHSFLKGKGKVGEDILYASGKNNEGQLGLGDFTNRTEWTEVPIRNRVLKSIVSKEEASMNKKRSGGK